MSESKNEGKDGKEKKKEGIIKGNREKIPTKMEKISTSRKTQERRDTTLKKKKKKLHFNVWDKSRDFAATNQI